MHKLKLLFTFIVCGCCLASCIDTEEYIVINADNSGTYTIKMDMGKMIELMNQFASGQGSTSQKPMPRIDSVIYFTDAVKTSTALTAAEKELYKDASFTIKIDSASNTFLVSMYCPFKHLSSLPEIRENLFTIANKLGIDDVVEGKNGTGDNKMQPADKDLAGALNPSSKGYVFTAEPGKISYKSKSSEANNLLAGDSMMQMMQQLTMITGDMSIKTVIQLPKPVKKISNSKAELSADKKRVVLQNTLTDLMEKPDAGEYELEY
jgi:hypothetical protein